MGKIKLSDQFFPFQCRYQECNREYKLDRFSNVASLWGLIFLINSDSAIIGLTCPDCIHTTIKKIPLQNAYALMPQIEHEGIQSANGYHPKVRFNYFVPFSGTTRTDSIRAKDFSPLQVNTESDTSYPLFLIPML